jgi:diaminopimelate epimerase
MPLKVHFSKYQATGNDFVLIDNRSGKYSFTKDEIERVCDRKFGIGADGLMLIEKHPDFDFNLVYYNRDGSQSLCGNGSRAAVHMASTLGILNGKTKFNAYDGGHAAEILPDGTIKLRMNDVSEVTKKGDDLFLHTGSPHFVRFVDDVKNYPVFENGKSIRYSNDFKPGGTNVNFIQLLPDNTIFVRTYERGVEDETLSCGTGVVASAIASSLRGYKSPVKVKTLGGELSVEFRTPDSTSENGHSDKFTDIFLAGPAKLVFEGDLEL